MRVRTSPTTIITTVGTLTKGGVCSGHRVLRRRRRRRFGGVHRPGEPERRYHTCAACLGQPRLATFSFFVSSTSFRRLVSNAPPLLCCLVGARRPSRFLYSALSCNLPCTEPPAISPSPQTVGTLISRRARSRRHRSHLKLVFTPSHASPGAHHAVLARVYDMP
jgi:hypothetical protein